MKNSLTINTKCDVVFEERVYKSHIQDITEQYIAISVPVFNGEYITLKDGENVNVIYQDKNNIYKFNSKIIGRKIDGISMLLLSPPDKIEEVQRRRYYRVDNLIGIKVMRVRRDITEEELNDLCANANEKDFVEAVMIDLSGGGLKVKVRMDVKDGDMFIVNLPLDKSIVNIPCYCVRAYKERDTGYYCCAFSFYNMDNRLREKIITYIFTIMRKNNKKL